MSKADLESIQGMLQQVIHYQKSETEERSIQNEILRGQIDAQSLRHQDLQRELSLHTLDHHNRAASHAGFCHNLQLQQHLSRTVADLSKLVESMARQSQYECESMRRSESPSVTAVPHPTSGRHGFTLRQESMGNLDHNSSRQYSPSRNIYEPRRVESAYNLRNYSEANLMSRYPSAYDPLYDRSLHETRHSILSSQYKVPQGGMSHGNSTAYLNEQPDIRVDTHDSLLMKSKDEPIYHEDQDAPTCDKRPAPEGQLIEPAKQESAPQEASQEEQIVHQEPQRQPIEQSSLPEPQEAALPEPDQAADPEPDQAAATESQEQQEKEEGPEEQEVEQNPEVQPEQPEFTTPKKKEEPYKFIPVQKFSTPENYDVTKYLTHLAARPRGYKNYGTHFNYGTTPQKRTYSPDSKRWYLENQQTQHEIPALPQYRYTSFSRKPLRYYHTLDDEDIVKEIGRLKDWQKYLEDQERDYRGSSGYNHYGFMRAYSPEEAGRKEKKGAIFNALKTTKIHQQASSSNKAQQSKDNKAWLEKVLKRKSKLASNLLATGGETPYAAFQKITKIVKTTSTKSVSKTANSTHAGTTGISGLTQQPDQIIEPTPKDVPEGEDVDEAEGEEYEGDGDAFYEDNATQEDQPPAQEEVGDVFD